MPWNRSLLAERVFTLPRIHERTVLWSLVLGFTVVMVLLGFSGWVATRDSAAIRKSAGRLVHEQLLMARLLHEVQVEQNALTAILHQLAKSGTPEDPARLLDELQEADAAIQMLSVEANQKRAHKRWAELEHRVASFTAEARRFLEDGGSDAPDDTLTLFDHHDEVVRMVDEMLGESSSRLSGADGELEMQSIELERESAVLLGASLVMALVCALATVLFAARNIRRIEWQADELSRVSWQMLQSQEVAARRFSHELHDELGQSLAAARSSLRKMSTSDLDESREDCIDLIDGAISNVRELSQLLRPVILDDFGLDAGLRFLIEKFAQRTRLNVEFDSDASGRYHEETETHLFRITQEALTNIARHSGASEVRISLHERTACLHLIIEDNGRGLTDREHRRSSLGMTGMRARARQSGGELLVEKAQPHGVRISVVVPARLPPQTPGDKTDAAFPIVR